jgi:hypothetical protein
LSSSFIERTAPSNRSSTDEVPLAPISGVLTT